MHPRCLFLIASVLGAGLAHGNVITMAGSSDIATLQGTDLPGADLPGSDPIIVALLGTALASHDDLQADVNDIHGTTYRDVGGVWHDLALVVPLRSAGTAMRGVVPAVATTPVFTIAAAGAAAAAATTATATAGDNELDAPEAPAVYLVPQPTSLALLAAGLLALAASYGRRDSDVEPTFHAMAGTAD